MSFRRLATIAALSMSLLLGGCRTAQSLLPPNFRAPAQNTGDSLKLAQLQLMQASPCCSSFADFSFRSTLPWEPQKFVLGNGSMVANLNGTQSYFLAFRLPTSVKLPYRVAVKSELNGRWLHASYLFAPTIVLLDEAFQPIRSEDIGLCEHMGWSDDTSGAFGSMKIEDPKARYLLVYSSAEQQAGKTYWEQSPASISTSTAASLQMSSAGSFSIPHGPDGSLWVGLMNNTYENALDNAICKKAAKGDGVLNTLRTVLPLPWSSKSTDNTGSPHGSTP
ncbi:MalM family protein [Rhodanobacter sp. AS-Z3]|uniref:MalM family protein n=1 Tax=Rhodanobacter sp. AS-Z3 TaxID=3031330 RepID=UPI00247AEB83|nr:MalM family protein [Rhodanobacter sp. AS-Z3]WEN16622.1 MalM family protein [Rhodanobacter sp. AS-Z3]